MVLWLIIIIVLLVLIALMFLFYYNRFVTLENRIDNSLSQIDVQLKRRYDLIPNLVNTVKGYMKHEKGVLTEVTRMRAKLVSGTMGEKAKASEDEIIGFEIVKTAIEEPFKQLMRNAGVDPGQLIAKARESSGKGFGFDVLQVEVADEAKPIDMIKAGIIDPLKVVRTAVQNAISVAAMILTTEALVTDLPEKNPPAAPGGMPGGMGGMGGY